MVEVSKVAQLVPGDPPIVLSALVAAAVGAGDEEEGREEREAAVKGAPDEPCQVRAACRGQEQVR